MNLVKTENYTGMLIMQYMCCLLTYLYVRIEQYSIVL